MRINILHNTYQQAGGEDSVVANEEMLLRKHGHEVHLHTVSNDSIHGLWSKVVTAWQTPYSWWGRREAMRIIEKTCPDVVHIHNFFPLLTPSIYDAFREAKVPVVQTLHNYRTICSGALLMRDGKPCEDCIKGTPYQAVLHGCYRDSRLGSLAVARMVDTHRRRRTWADKVDRFIALAEFAKEKFVEAGFPSEKIVVKPNFVEAVEFVATADANRNGALFVGRLSEEKGIETLLRAWELLDVPLCIIGDGPLMDRMRRKAPEPVALLGRKKPKQVAEEMARAAFLVMPSECYESFPMTIAETFACGLPVIASRLGAMAEIVEDNVTGLHFTPGDAEDLAKKVRWASEHPEDMRRMGRNARQIYEEKYTPEINYRQLIAIYEGSIKENRQNRTDLSSAN
jgi:glycosyltransferase involved in cell wall biosynthesis